MKKYILIAFLILCSLTISQPSFAIEPTPAEHEELTPNQKLIYAVKGYRNEYALLAGVINPVFGLIAAAYDYPETFQDLTNIDNALAEGADINYQDGYGYTALIYAAYYGYPNIANHLVLSGANVGIKERHGYNAYAMAKFYVKDFKKLKQTNETKPLSETYSEKDKIMMRDYYIKRIQNYQQVVDLLEPLTSHRK